MIRRNSRYFETAELMDKAFLDLLEERDFELITAKDVCARAGVSRSTFYLHYESFADLVEESVRFVFGRFRETFSQEAEREVFACLASDRRVELNFVAPEYLKPYLEFIRENRKLFAAMVRNSGVLGMHDAYAKMERHLIAPILDRYRVPEWKRRYMMRFYIGGLMAVLEEWIRRGCEDPIDEIASIMQQCCMPGDCEAGVEAELDGEQMRSPLPTVELGPHS